MNSQTEPYPYPNWVTQGSAGFNLWTKKNATTSSRIGTFATVIDAINYSVAEFPDRIVSDQTRPPAGGVL